MLIYIVATSPGYFYLFIELHILQNPFDPNTSYKIRICLNRNLFPAIIGTTSTINGVNYLQNNSTYYELTQTNGTDYNGTVDVDAFLSYGLGMGDVAPYDVLESVRIAGVQVTGQYTIDWQYSVDYLARIFMGNETIAVVTLIPCALTVY